MASRGTRIWTALLLLGTSAAISLGGAEKAISGNRSFLLATASKGGTFYPVGVALATLATAKLQKKHRISLTAINSAGSAENLQLLRMGEAQFAIIQGLFGYYAWHGKGPLSRYGPQKNLRSVMTLWENVEQYVILTKHVRTGTILDLESVRGMHAAFGKSNSGTINSNRVLLKNLGFDIDKHFQLVRAGYGPSAEALQRGQVVVMGTPAGVPTAAVTRTMSALGNRATILNFTDEQARRADGGLGLWTRFVIPAGTYPAQKKDILTISQPNLLTVRADVDVQVVYLLTKSIFENLTFLRTMHAATNAISLERALAGLPLPLHPGALRYFREAKLKIPQPLLAAGEKN
jgi:TRAP transporter TAXI family solute receptor